MLKFYAIYLIFFLKSLPGHQLPVLEKIANKFNVLPLPALVYLIPLNFVPVESELNMFSLHRSLSGREKAYEKEIYALMPSLRNESFMLDDIFVVQQYHSSRRICSAFMMVPEETKWIFTFQLPLNPHIFLKDLRNDSILVIPHPLSSNV